MPPPPMPLVPAPSTIELPCPQLVLVSSAPCHHWAPMPSGASHSCFDHRLYHRRAPMPPWCLYHCLSFLLPLVPLPPVLVLPPSSHALTSQCLSFPLSPPLVPSSSSHTPLSVYIATSPSYSNWCLYRQCLCPTTGCLSMPLSFPVSQLTTIVLL